MSKQSYIDALSGRLNEVQEEIAKLRSEVQEALNKIEEKQNQAKNLTELLAAEGVQPPNRAELKDGSVSDLAYEVLARRDDESPVHYKDLSDVLSTQGIVVPGKNPPANLLAHITRDERFMRVAPGTYALTEWGLSPDKTTRRKTRKRRRSARSR